MAQSEISQRSREASPRRRFGALQVLIDVKDAVVLRLRTIRRPSERERREYLQSVAEDPALRQALSETLEAHPQFRETKASDPAIPDKHR
jgi:hypothetical protein